MSRTKVPQDPFQEPSGTVVICVITPREPLTGRERRPPKCEVRMPQAQKQQLITLSEQEVCVGVGGGAGGGGGGVQADT